MPVDIPRNFLNRSERLEDRANEYSRRQKEFLATGSTATRVNTDLGWQRQASEIEAFFSRWQVMLVCFVGFGFGLTMLVVAIGKGNMGAFVAGFPFVVVGGITSAFIGARLIKAFKVDSALFEHAISIDMMQEVARNGIRANFTNAELQLVATKSNVEMKEMELALQAAMWAALSDTVFQNNQAATAADIREKDYQLSRMDKERVLQEAIARAQVSQTEATGKANVAQTEAEGDVLVKRIRLERELEADAALDKLKAEERRWQREMTLIDKKDSTEIRRQRLNEVTQLRKVLVATHAELRKNPALRDELSGLIDDVTTLQEMLAKLNPMTEEENALAEALDQKMLKLVYKRHGLDDDSKSA